jgi:hypothetical protein
MTPPKSSDVSWMLFMNVESYRWNPMLLEKPLRPFLALGEFHNDHSACMSAHDRQEVLLLIEVESYELIAAIPQQFM